MCNTSESFDDQKKRTSMNHRKWRRKFSVDEDESKTSVEFLIGIEMEIMRNNKPADF